MSTQPVTRRTLSFRACQPRQAKRGICLWFLLFALGVPISAQDSAKRPRITGVDHVRLCVADIDKSQEFYSKLVGVRFMQGDCFDASYPCFTIGWRRNQKLELARSASTDAENLLAEIAFGTDDVVRMHKYLRSKGIEVSEITKEKYEKEDFAAHFSLRQPDGTSISFIQRFYFPADDPGPGHPWYVQMIHAGFIVRDRAAMEHFYKDILGFRPYWHGGMKEDQTDWVSLQVPDGTDWVEFMVNVPENADQHLRGVMNHIALGVPDIHQAREQLVKNGLHLTEEPKLGRDGKWQLNLYDPDQTRIEFMEFTPKEKPCCSEFTGPHPQP